MAHAAHAQNPPYFVGCRCGHLRSLEDGSPPLDDGSLMGHLRPSGSARASHQTPSPCTASPCAAHMTAHMIAHTTQVGHRTLYSPVDVLARSRSSPVVIVPRVRGYAKEEAGTFILGDAAYRARVAWAKEAPLRPRRWPGRSRPHSSPPPWRPTRRPWLRPCVPFQSQSTG
jgi:hypothetical protein